MNISLRSFTQNNAGSSIQVANTRFSKFSISNFFVSHSTTSFFASFSNKQESFSLTGSFFNKYLSPVINVQCNSNDDKAHTYRVERTTIMNSVSIYQGSALCCRQASLQVYVSKCTFINCTSTSTGPSEQRDSYTSGGACFFSVGEVTLKYNLFKACTGMSLGSAVYASTPLNNKAEITCICDVDCGNYAPNTYSSIHAFEMSTTTAKDINSTNPITTNYCGYIHIGMYPKTFSLKYVLMKARTDDSVSIPLGMSLYQSTDIGHLEHACFYDCKSANGLLSLWRGNYILNDIYFYECSGNIYHDYGFQTITFKNTSFSPSIQLINAKTDETCLKANKETVILMKCQYNTNNTLCSIKKGAKYLPTYPLFLIIILQN